MSILATLFWGVVFFTVWVPVAVVLRVVSGRRLIVRHDSALRSLWRPRRTRAFRDMERMR